MINNNLRTSPLFIACILSILLMHSVTAQYEDKHTAELKEEAKSSFDKGDYADAVQKYRILLKRYPKDGTFSYYCGISLLEMNQNADEAIRYLELASTRPTTPPKVFYYLGQAYSRNYQFQSASKAFRQFDGLATKAELKELRPEYLSESADLAASLLPFFQEAEVLEAKYLSFDDTLQLSEIRSPAGTLTRKPPAWFPSAEGKEGLRDLLFLPSQLSEGNKIFYAGPSKNRKNGNDIFISRIGRDGKLSGTESPAALNTEDDEIIPCFVAAGADLYFSSRGHNSTGGYDIFRSHYDSLAQAWSDPENVGFPVNSPFDDLLGFPGSDTGTFYLVSNRQDPDSLPVLYKILLTEKLSGSETPAPSELRKKGMFEGIVPQSYQLNSGTVIEAAESQAENSWREEAQRVIPLEYLSPDFNRFLKTALEEQLLADSLAALAREARIKARGIENPEEKWALQRKIVEWEKQVEAHQAKADENYRHMKPPGDIKAETSSEVQPMPPVIAEDTMINSITVYHYRSPDSTSIENPVADSTTSVPAVAIAIPVNADSSSRKEANPDIKKLNEFKILERSPYSASNPFPEDRKMPAGAYYKIQLAALGKNPDPNAFGGISPVTAEPIPGKAVKKYYAGRFTEYEKAKSALEEVRRKGFDQAFIVGWYDGIKMTVAKVYELERAR